jgi:hypothetical protein
MFRRKKEEGRRKKEEGRRKKSEGSRREVGLSYLGEKIDVKKE